MLSDASKLASTYFSLFYRSVHVLYTEIQLLCLQYELFEFNMSLKWSFSTHLTHFGATYYQHEFCVVVSILYTHISLSALLLDPKVTILTYQWPKLSEFSTCKINNYCRLIDLYFVLAFAIFHE